MTPPPPAAGACTVFGIILLMLIEHGLNGFLSGPPHSHHGHDHGHTPKPAHAHEHEHKHEVGAKEDIEVASEASEHREEEHGHACMAHDSTASWLKSAPVGSGTLRAQVRPAGPMGAQRPTAVPRLRAPLRPAAACRRLRRT